MNGFQATMIMAAIGATVFAMLVMIMSVVIMMRMTMMIVMVVAAVRPAVFAMFMVMTMVMVVMIVIIRLQESGFDFQNTVEIESIAAENGVERHIAFHRAVDFRIRIDAADARFDFFDFSRRHQIRLVDDDDIGKGDLVLGFGRIFQTRGQEFRIRHCDNRIEAGLVCNVLIDKEGLRDGGGISQTCGLDNDRVKLALTLHQAFDDADEIAAHRAADAAIVHLEHFFIGADDEIIVDADLAEFIHNDRIFMAMLLGEDAVEQSGLAGTKIAGEHGDGCLLRHNCLRKGSGRMRPAGKGRGDM